MPAGNRPAMKQSISIPGLTAIGLIGAGLYGCISPHPYIREGDANRVEVSYYGDVATTLPLAKEHCARFERVPRLSDPGVDIALYDCVRR